MDGDHWEIVGRWKNGQISQRSFKECPAITKISQWSVSDRPVISMVAMVSSRFWLSPKQSLSDRQGKRSLNECLMNAQQIFKVHSKITQRSHRSPNYLSAIFQWTPNLSTLKAERSKSAQGSNTKMAFPLLLRDRWEIRPIFDRPAISVLCKGPHFATTLRPVVEQ